MRKLSWILGAALFLGAAAAQTVPLTQNSLTNEDIVTLAKAGFNEDFIVDFIAISRTRFDITVAGLAGLAKEGLSERLIRVMLSPANVPPSGASAAPLMMMPVPEAKPRKMSDQAMAVSAQTPYYRSSTFLWGLIRKQVGINAMPPSYGSTPLQPGTAFGGTRMTPMVMGSRYVVVR